MNLSSRLLVFAVLFSAFWFAATTTVLAGETELHVLALKHRQADEVVPVVQPLLLPGESVSGLEMRLIVRATPQTLNQITRLLTEIDTPRRNLRISLRHTGERSQTQNIQGTSASGQQGTTQVIVTTGDHGNRGGSAGLTTTNVTVQRRSERHISTRSDSLTQTLIVMDGGRAFLRIGETITQVQPYLALAGNRLGAVAGIQYSDVTSGFEVEPHILGEMIHLTVMPRLAFQSNQGTQNVVFQELRTEVTIRPGEWTDLGGAVQSGNSVNRQILGSGSDNSQYQIRVDPL